uniref:Myomegalin n=1 Tax=Monopterus albus TaxID=43700 RepID=A0A3Q3KE90_MONAL
EGQGLTEVKQLVEQKRVVERELGELKAQLEKAGFSSLAQMSKFDALVQAQAKELSLLRQRLREGRGVCSILTQHLGDTTKAFEELLRATDIDYYMGQSFREQLAQSSALAQRVSAKISGRESFSLVMSLYTAAFTDSFHFQIATLTVAPCHTIHLSLHPMPHPTEPSPASAVPACSAPDHRSPNLQTRPVGQVGRGLALRSRLEKNKILLCIFNLSLSCSTEGSDLMKEHLREIRSLRQRLEDSIQTNDRLRQQLEERLALTATEKGNMPLRTPHSVSALRLYEQF